MEIVRYRLIGPQSHSVLAATLEAATACDVRLVKCIHAFLAEGLCFYERLLF